VHPGPDQALRSGQKTTPESSEEKQPSSPTVRVTIGRIVVRMKSKQTSSPAAPPRHRPVVSLDDYLKHTAGSSS
jgi:hypothetical protein